ncbi:Nif3-like dinuclear metal center hexameric protein [Blattabacterium cuenoti]|uniref:Nif3-like dinuclear metal center hexameric protein n=1 Tax=Blattabacterium cuenoti TaxID=1653831 RepID=UPI001CC24612|nr:Nif3-like dinuclear metal center hexameric protein [Blattabacterium cuenoti]
MLDNIDFFPMEIMVKDISDKLEDLAPLDYSEPYDNVGLIVGDLFKKIQNILITLDLTEEVMIESINKKCDLIIVFHPVIFHPIKKINGNTFSERVIIYAIKHDISIYVIHTNLDAVWEGTGSFVYNLLKINKEKVLIPRKGTMKKLNTYVPVNYAEKVRNALFLKGAGNISNYSHCSYNVEGLGSYMGNEYTRPFFGKKEVFHLEKEICISVLVPNHKLKLVKEALFQTHPYEEVAYEIYDINNTNPHIGIGMVGNLIDEMNLHDFLSYIKKNMNLSCIKYSNRNNKKKIKRVSMIPGSGRFGIESAIKEQSDAFISSDFKYHDFFKSEKDLVILDIGHYESENFNKNLIKSFLEKNFDSIFVFKSEINTNPVEYYY